MSSQRKSINVGRNNAAILRGEAGLDTWDEEELIRGQRRAANGKFMGRPPKVVPMAVHDELVRRKMTKAYDLLADSIYDAVAVLVEVAQDTEADPAVRVKAATEILNRTIGKPKETLELGVAGAGVRPLFDQIADAVEVAIDREFIDVESKEDGAGG